MAEDVKAVAWLVANGRTFVDRAFVGIEAAEHARDTRNDGAEVQPLYPQQAIDALRAEVERLRADVETLECNLVAAMDTIHRQDQEAQRAEALRFARAQGGDHG